MRPGTRSRLRGGIARASPHPGDPTAAPRCIGWRASSRARLPCVRLLNRSRGSLSEKTGVALSQRGIVPAGEVHEIGSPPPPLLVAPMSPAKNVEGTLHGLVVGGVMGTGQPHDFTLIFGRARAGDERARGELIELVYDELRRIASGLMRRERTDHTLSPTAVVHEAVIRLLGGAVFDKAADRTYLFASAARAMREVLVDHARRRATDRRGGGRRRVPLDGVLDYFEAAGTGRHRRPRGPRPAGGVEPSPVAGHDLEILRRADGAGGRRVAGGLGGHGGEGLAAGAGLARRPAPREVADDTGTLASDRRPVRCRRSGSHPPSARPGSAEPAGTTRRSGPTSLASWTRTRGRPGTGS